jgi:hypothetical protein
MSVKAEWANYVGGWAGEIYNDKHIPIEHPLRVKIAKVIKDGAEAKAVMKSLEDFDKAADAFAKVTDLAGRKKAYGEMNQSSSEFRTTYGKLTNYIIQNLNPAGKTFYTGYSAYATKLSNRQTKVMGLMNEKLATALKGVQTLEKGAPERPKTPPPAH